MAYESWRQQFLGSILDMEVENSGQQSERLTAVFVSAHSTPFQVRVRFDGGEEHVAGGTDPTACETCPASATTASGADGFYLTFTQQTC